MRRETALKIIGRLRKELGRGLTILELSKKLKIGYRPAYNHITELEKEKAIIVKTVGRAKQSFLNLDSPRCRYFLQEVDLTKKEALYKANPKLKAVLEGLISRITAAFTAEIHSIVLFGSYASATDDASSDIDICLISNVNKEFQAEKYEKRYLPARAFGVIIVTTSKGLMLLSESVEKKLGGKLLAYCY